jgi:hypothetical protein
MLIVTSVGVKVLILTRRILIFSESAKAAILADQGTILHGILLVLAMSTLEVFSTSARFVGIAPRNEKA